MDLNEPIVFEPLAMERVWGGRALESLYGKRLPQGTPVGEIWEIVDREEAQSVVHTGPLRGTTLHELWVKHREKVFGVAYAGHPAQRFPILAKLLDAREKLSVQVHPPAKVAAALQGEPKTEVWYFAQTQPGAKIYAGLKRGTTRENFEHLLRSGEVEKALHAIEVEAGESIFIPSGRMHAIGGGNVIVEIQQNSDTTYRVFDWNRVGLDNQPRALHIDASLLSTDFSDYEPTADRIAEGTLAECHYFRVEKLALTAPQTAAPNGQFAIFTVLSGGVTCGNSTFKAGDFFLAPATLASAFIAPAKGGAEVLRTTLPV